MEERASNWKIIRAAIKDIEKGRSLEETFGDYKTEYKTSDVNSSMFRPYRIYTEAGKASNMIVRMINKGATEDELIRAITHFLVVCDSKKYVLDYKRSYKDYNIKELETKYPRN